MTAHRGCMNTITESAFKVDSGRTDPLSHLHEYCTWHFGPNHWAVPPQCTCLTKPAHFSCVSLTSHWQPLTTHTYTKHAAYYTHTHWVCCLLHTHTPSMLLTAHTPSMLISWQGRQWIPQCHTLPHEDFTLAILQIFCAHWWDGTLHQVMTWLQSQGVQCLLELRHHLRHHCHLWNF